MAITRTSWIDDDGSGQIGTILNNAEKTTLYDQIDAALAANGSLILIPHTTGNFGASGGTWTVPSAQYAYSYIGNSLLLSVFVATSTTTGSSSQLTLWNPIRAGDYTGTGTAWALVPGGGYETCTLLSFPNNQAIAILRNLGASWPAGTVTLYASILVPHS